MTQESAAPTWREYWPRRFTLVGLCFAGTFVCYIDRVNISVAIIPMASEFGWDRTLQGVILSSFFYGYLATQIAGGSGLGIPKVAGLSGIGRQPIKFRPRRLDVLPVVGDETE